MPEEGDESRVAAEAQTQQYGYIRCYRAVVRDCGIAAAYLYGILEDYAQLGARNGRPVMPSHDHLATLMQVHRNTIPGHLGKLREAGWITSEGGRGAPHLYTLPIRQLHRNRATGGDEVAQKLGNSCTVFVQPVAQKLCINKNKSKTEQKDTPLKPPTGGRYTAEFETFWTGYPAVVNNSKARAFRAWGRLSREDRAAALVGLAKYIASPGWREGFAPHAATYLNGRLWESEPPEGRARVNGNGARPEERRPGVPSLEEVLQPARALSPEKLAELREWRERA